MNFHSDTVNECYYIYVKLFYQNMWFEGNFVKQDDVEKNCHNYFPSLFHSIWFTNMNHKVIIMQFIDTFLSIISTSTEPYRWTESDRHGGTAGLLAPM